MRQRGDGGRRIHVIFFVIVGIAFVIVWRLVKLQLIDGAFYARLALGQYEVYRELFPERGAIVLSNTLLSEEERYIQENLHPVATNKEYWQLYAVPSKVNAPRDVARTLSDILFELQFDSPSIGTSVDEDIDDTRGEGGEGKLTPEERLKEREQQKENFFALLLARLSKSNDPYEPIMGKITDDVKARIEEFHFPGIEFARDIRRLYPEGEIGSHVVGFVGETKYRARQGLYGIESFFEKRLAGKQGYLKSERDVAGRLIALSENDLREAVDGDDIVLTLDYTLQNFACHQLSEAKERYRAAGGSVIIMQPKSGALLALCSSPEFDPNTYSRVEDIAYYNNNATFYAYEPGSVFKPITLAAGLDLGKITPQSTYDDQGLVVVGGLPIRNSDLKAHGRTNMVQLLQLSLNTGTVFVADTIGAEAFKEYVRDFGFGSVTGIELPSEHPGNIEALNKSGFVYTATASFGQGILVTPLQLVAAYSALANGGILMRPFIVDRIITSDGKVEIEKPKEVRSVISQRTATLISGMLVTVVAEGHGFRGGVKGYHIAGKTGTAQVAEGGEYQETTIHTFAGFGPVENPIFTMVVRLDNPQEGRFAESTAAPLFGEIAKFILQYYQVPPNSPS